MALKKKPVTGMKDILPKEKSPFFTLPPLPAGLFNVYPHKHIIALHYFNN